jgi:hypothetical protein
MSRELRNALFSIAFYIIVLAAILYFNASGRYKSGPCTPNLDILSVFFLGPLSLMLLIRNGIWAFVMKKQTKYSFLIHLLALVIWLIVLVVD